MCSRWYRIVTESSWLVPAQGSTVEIWREVESNRNKWRNSKIDQRTSYDIKGLYTRVVRGHQGTRNVVE
jgi:hypothetical protein